jgi:DNA-binding Lrp family transcriptional regulator
MHMVMAFVLIKLGTGEHLSFAKSAKEEIAKIKGVAKVYGVFGRYDLVAHVEASTLEELSRIITDKIRAIAGVSTTESLIIGF